MRLGAVRVRPHRRRALEPDVRRHRARRRPVRAPPPSARARARQRPRHGPRAPDPGGCRSSTYPSPRVDGLRRSGRDRGPVLRDGLRGRSLTRDRRHSEVALISDARASASRSLVDTMAKIHAVDLVAVGLDDLGRHEGTSPGSCVVGTARSENGTPTICRRSTASTMRWRHASPTRSAPRSCTATTGSTTAWSTTTVSWSQCSTGRSLLGDPMADVGLLTVYWTGPDDPPGAWTAGYYLPGFRPRSPIAERYAEVSGTRCSNLDFIVARTGSWHASSRGCTTRYLRWRTRHHRDRPSSDSAEQGSTRAATSAEQALEQWHDGTTRMTVKWRTPAPSEPHSENLLAAHSPDATTRSIHCHDGKPDKRHSDRSIRWRGAARPQPGVAGFLVMLTGWIDAGGAGAGRWKPSRPSATRHPSPRSTTTRTSTSRPDGRRWSCATGSTACCTGVLINVSIGRDRAGHDLVLLTRA